MHRQPVSSSNIASIGYDPDAQILEVEFTNGSLYQYLNVPEHHHAGIMAAPSHGTYLNTHIKGTFPYQKV